MNRLHYNDQSDVVSIYTRQRGTVGFMVRRSRRGKAGSSEAALGALSMVEVVWDEHGGGLQRPKELSLSHSWSSLPFHPHKTAMVLLLAEFLYRALRSEQANESLFDYLTNGLQWLDEAESGYANFHVVFLTHLTRYLGFQPNITGWRENSYFDLQTACFVDSPPAHDNWLSPVEASQLPLLLRVDVRSMSRLAWNGRWRRRALTVLARYYRLHLAEFPEVRSIEVLAEVFD
ncbi:MAG: DNA repair protein RecO C-terminal domain-containing protein [Bacteroidaceae bacterium]|nr:DNA repair protein RecO C-terminal domain-containing protein [Bacteroidaceae bacterium]